MTCTVEADCLVTRMLERRGDNAVICAVSFIDSGRIILSVFAELFVEPEIKISGVSH